MMAGELVGNGNVSTSQCAVCQIKADKKCTGCNEVAYCGKEHQKKHWLTHKKECKCWRQNLAARLNSAALGNTEKGFVRQVAAQEAMIGAQLR